MNKLLNDLEFKVYTAGITKAGASGTRRLIQGYASVGDVLDRQNEIITLGALVRAKEDLLKNNTIFFNHEHNALPIGKTIAAEVDENGLLITVEISQSKSADDIWTLIEEGILNSFSIGGRVLQAEEKRDDLGNLFNEITKIELFETSVVGLPANPAAKFELISKSFSMAITEEMRKKGEEQDMAKDNKEVKKEVELEKPIEEVETKNTSEVEVTKSEEDSKEIEKNEEVKEVEKSEEVVELTRSERKEALLKELKELEAEEPETVLEESKEEVVEDSEKSVEEVEVVKDASEETSQEVISEVKEKSTDEQILDTLGTIVQLLAKTEEKPEVKEEVESEIETEEVEEPQAAKSVEVLEEAIEKKVEKKVESKKVVEEDISRKGQAQVIIAEAPYGTEDGLSDKETARLLAKAKEVAWTKLFFGNK